MLVMKTNSSNSACNIKSSEIWSHHFVSVGKFEKIDPYRGFGQLCEVSFRIQGTSEKIWYVRKSQLHLFVIRDILSFPRPEFGFLWLYDVNEPQFHVVYRLNFNFGQNICFMYFYLIIYNFSNKMMDEFSFFTSTWGSRTFEWTRYFVSTVEFSVNFEPTFRLNSF